MTEKLGVYKAIAKVTGAMAKEGIGKGRKNQQQGYSFRGIDDVYNTLSGMLADAGLCIIPRVLSRSMTEKQTKSGSPLFYVVVECEYDLVAADDGSKHTARSIGEAMDSADKATNKAMSAAYKYMALQTFAIPTEGDNDADQYTPSPAPSANHQKPATPPPQKVKEQAAAMRANKPKVDVIEGTATRVDENGLPPEAGDLSDVGAPDNKPDIETMRKIVKAFESIGYDIPAVEEAYKKNVDDWTTDDIPKVRELFSSLKAMLAAGEQEVI